MKTNPALFAAYMEVVENQIRDNTPPETRLAYERMKKEGISESDAKIYIGRVIASETFWIMKKSEPFNLQRYIKNLNRLPAEPEE